MLDYFGNFRKLNPLKISCNTVCAYMNTHFKSTLTTALEILNEYTHYCTGDTSQVNVIRNTINVYTFETFCTRHRYAQ